MIGFAKDFFKKKSEMALNNFFAETWKSKKI